MNSEKRYIFPKYFQLQLTENTYKFHKKKKKYKQKLYLKHLIRVLYA